MSTGRHECDETEHNFVADAFNWEQRVKGELSAARAWSGNWGDVFAPDSPKSYKEMIAKLQEKMETLPVQAMMSNSQMSYTPAQPYTEYGKNYKRKTANWGDE